MQLSLITDPLAPKWILCRADYFLYYVSVLVLNKKLYK